MTETITSEPAGKRGRNGSVILTDRICEKRVNKRVKIYDKKYIRRMAGSTCLRPTRASSSHNRLSRRPRMT
jgi:hypothetical protein